MIWPGPGTLYCWPLLGDKASINDSGHGFMGSWRVSNEPTTVLDLSSWDTDESQFDPNRSQPAK